MYILSCLLLGLQDEVRHTVVVPLFEVQRLWHLAAFVNSQAHHEHMPAAAQLVKLQSDVKSKLDSLQQPPVMAELPYKLLSQIQSFLDAMLQSARETETAEPFLQLASISAKAQESITCIKAHINPVNNSSTSLLTGWSVFWGMALHSGIKLPATLHSRSSQMAGEPAAVTPAAVHAFTSLCSDTHRLSDNSDDLLFLLHFLTQDSALFQGYLMANFKQCAEEQPSGNLWPDEAPVSALMRMHDLHPLHHVKETSFQLGFNVTLLLYIVSCQSCTKDIAVQDKARHYRSCLKCWTHKCFQFLLVLYCRRRCPIIRRGFSTRFSINFCSLLCIQQC